MKPVSELTVCIIDYGTFAGLAEMFGRAGARTFYYTPFEAEYLEFSKCCVGDGCENFERVDEFLDPDFVKSVDLFVFPDRGFQGHQKLFRSLGKAVWGSFGACELEEYRTLFVRVVEELGLPIVHSQTVRGWTALAQVLRDTERKWVKIDRYRGDAETFFHLDWTHSQREMERQAKRFGPFKERVVYVVQDEIEGDVVEIGYDGLCVDGAYPSRSFHGFEAKNEAYLGALRDYGKLPAEVLLVNEHLKDMLARFGYRNFLSTEIRVRDGVPNFTDPTTRLAGQTMEHQFRNCSNLPEVIWFGANGELIEPEFDADYAAIATLHHHTQNECEDWKTLVVPDEAHVALYHYCFDGQAYQFPSMRNDEVGVVIGLGDSIEEAIDDLKDNFKLLKDEPVSINEAAFPKLVEQIEQGEEQGVEFSDSEVPEPGEVL